MGLPASLFSSRYDVSLAPSGKRLRNVLPRQGRKQLVRVAHQYSILSLMPPNVAAVLYAGIGLAFTWQGNSRRNGNRLVTGQGFISNRSIGDRHDRLARSLGDAAPLPGGRHARDQREREIVELEIGLATQLQADLSIVGLEDADLGSVALALILVPPQWRRPPRLTALRRQYIQEGNELRQRKADPLPAHAMEHEALRVPCGDCGFDQYD